MAARAALLPAPPLQTGDHLSRAEFERRYEAAPDIKKAELIEGVVYVGSPVRAEFHGDMESDMAGWLAVYRAAHLSLRTSSNATVRLDLENEFQPDLSLRKPASDGGTTRIEAGYIAGPPELVIEISASSASIDLYAKKEVYRRNAVQEYIVWRVYDGVIDWFRLREGRYELLPPDERGVVHSEVFPGLRLHVQAMLDGDLAAVLREQSGA